MNNLERDYTILYHGRYFFVICFIAYWIIKRILKSIKQNYKHKITTSFKCLDGHIVRSKGELIIDNHLHHLGIEHEYENTTKIWDKSIKYDWHLLKYEIYIEYWGYTGKIK